MEIRKEDRYEFINDILSLWEKYKTVELYWPEDLEDDFYVIMKKWEELCCKREGPEAISQRQGRKRGSMTREEAINLLADMDSDKYTAKEAVALTMAIKALEFKDVLDKIRAEIEQVAFKDVNGSKYIFVSRVNQIINKYKAESEEENGTKG